MTAVLVWFVIGTALGAATWTLTRSMFDVPSLQRTNYRTAPLVTGVGMLVPVVLVLVAAAALVWERLAPSVTAWGALLWPSLLAAFGFALLGLFDDVAGQGQSGGFGGHLDELRGGRLTSGVVKLGAGAALGIVAADPLWRGSSGSLGVLELLRDGAVVALAANLANLFDRAPGRTIKVTTVGFVAAALVARSSVLAVPAAGIGAGLGLLRADLSERAMLGDAGSNPLGALCGIAALVATPSATGRWVLLGSLLVANALSEAVSFSAVIDAVRPLRWFDRWGSQRPH